MSKYHRTEDDIIKDIEKLLQELKGMRKFTPGLDPNPLMPDVPQYTQNKCPKCNMTFGDGFMGYVCSVPGCPISGMSYV